MVSPWHSSSVVGFLWKERLWGFSRIPWTRVFPKEFKCCIFSFGAKRRGVEDLKDFRLIRLVGGLYKLLPKVLANRLQRVVGNLVLDFWHAFVADRIKGNLRGIICKLDIEKAYDHVDWSFVLALLEKMDFGSKWISGIKWCISTAWFFVLLNGSPLVFFQSSKGMGLGDPFSPDLLLSIKVCTF